MREFQIIGVEHSEPRNTEEILKWVESPVACVYHETAEDDGSYWGLLWLLVAPAQAINLILNSIAEPRIDTECRKAALELAQKHSLDKYVPIDQSYQSRVFERPRIDIIIEYGIPLAILALYFTNSLELEFLLLGIFTFPLIGKINEHREIRRRNEQIVQNLLNHLPDDQGKEIIIVGEDHVAVIGGRLQAKGHSVDALWLNSMLKED